MDAYTKHLEGGMRQLERSGRLARRSDWKKKQKLGKELRGGWGRVKILGKRSGLWEIFEVAKIFAI